MAPPGMKEKKKKPAVAIAVGVGKPGGMAPPGMEDDDEGIDHPEAHDQSAESGGKVTREKALFIPADHHCKDCVNYDASSGDCSKVEGVFDAEDSCLRYFRHANPEDEEPDADDQGGPPDMDADDQNAQ